MEGADESLTELIVTPEIRLTPGASVALDGYYLEGAAKRFVVVDIRSHVESAPLQSASMVGQRSLLVVPMLGRGFAVDGLRAQFEAARFGDYYRQASNGAFRLNVTFIESGDPLDCSGFDYHKTEVRDAARLRGYNVDNFDFVMSLVHPTREPYCQYAGLSTVGGNRSIIAYWPPMLDMRVVAHEFGHNLGLRHANGINDSRHDLDNGIHICQPTTAFRDYHLASPLSVSSDIHERIGGCEYAEYFDFYTVMGLNPFTDLRDNRYGYGNPRMYSAYERSRLGWPVRRVDAEFPWVGVTNVRLDNLDAFAAIPFGSHTLIVSNEKLEGAPQTLAVRLLSSATPFGAQGPVILETLYPGHDMRFADGQRIRWLAQDGEHALVQLSTTVEPSCTARCASMCRDDNRSPAGCRLCLQSCASAIERTLRQTCVDAIWNQDEWGTDCGGSCAQCDGLSCSADTECSSSHCWSNHTCQPTEEPMSCELSSDCTRPGQTCWRDGICHDGDERPACEGPNCPQE